MLTFPSQGLDFTLFHAKQNSTVNLQPGTLNTSSCHREIVVSQKTYASCIASPDPISDPIVSHFFTLYRLFEIFRNLRFATPGSPRISPSTAGRSGGKVYILSRHSRVCAKRSSLYQFTLFTPAELPPHPIRVASCEFVVSQKTYASCIALPDPISNPIVPHFFALYRLFKNIRKSHKTATVARGSSQSFFAPKNARVSHPAKRDPCAREKVLPMYRNIQNARCTESVPPI